MGLQKDITLDNGINLPTAYIVIGSITYVNKYHVSINVNIYKDKTSKLDGKQEVVKFKHICVDDFVSYFESNILDTENVNIVSQGYLWLKTLPYYSDAIDVLDIKE